MSNHFTGLDLGPPLGDQRLTSATSTLSSRPPTHREPCSFLNANPTADALHPDAIYRLAN